MIISLCGAPLWAQTVEQIKPSTSASGVSAIGGVANEGKSVGAIEVGQTKATDAISVASSQTAALEWVLKGLRARQMTPQEAWDNGALDVDGVLWLLEKRIDQWGGFFYEKDESLRRDITKLLVEHGGARIETIEKLSPWVRLWLADYYGSVGDERVLALSESVIGELKAGALGQEDLAFQAVERIGWFYRDKGEYEKSAQVWLRLPPLLKMAGWQAPDSLIEAARAYEKAGLKTFAHATYQQIIVGDNEEFSSGALWEQGSQLLQRGEIEAALQLLREAEAKLSQQANRKGVVSASLLGYGHYLKGDWNTAREYYQKALARGTQLSSIQQNSVRDIVNNGRKMLGLIGQWEQKPLVSDPQQIEISGCTHSA